MGLAVGVDRDVALEVLLEDGTVRKILSGDVVLITKRINIRNNLQNLGGV